MADHPSPTPYTLPARPDQGVPMGRISGLRAAREDEASMMGDKWSARRPDPEHGGPVLPPAPANGAGFGGGAGRNPLRCVRSVLCPRPVRCGASDPLKETVP